MTSKSSPLKHQRERSNSVQHSRIRFLTRKLLQRVRIAYRKAGLRAELILIATLLAFIIPAFGLGYKLTTGEIWEGQNITALYLLYSASVLFALHGILFAINDSMRTHRFRYRKKVPKILEYLYAAIISIGLLQVLVSGPRFHDYVTLVTGGEDAITEEIRAVAERYMKKECIIPSGFFTKEYCAKIDNIRNADNLRQYTLTVLLKDQEFLTHTTNVIATQGGAVRQVSPIVGKALQLRTLVELSEGKVDASTINVFAWIGLLLLPIGIGLRMVKTSLELFGDLD